ncbi:MAG TPA: pilus assembly PilX N-terminal domain-containing protein, partial [Candidatus Dormibacteraeota bacterium]|nr:pilus assembly PilX N-terminal domain-containing protein [Candidatus Dormibacteraeota bacterium]
MLISLFALLLISVVGVALILASGTDTALTGNYHSATSVYYAALAGLEEGRGRLLPKSPNYLTPAFVGPVGGILAPGEVRYILNPLPDETVAPWDLGTPSTYPDTEYFQEFGA